MSKFIVVATHRKGRCAVASCHSLSGSTLLEEMPCVGVNSTQSNKIFQSHNHIISQLSRYHGDISDIYQTCIVTIRLIQRSLNEKTLEERLQVFNDQTNSHSLTNRDDTKRIASVVHAFLAPAVPLTKCLQYADIILRNSFAITDYELRYVTSTNSPILYLTFYFLKTLGVGVLYRHQCVESQLFP
jgi:hypothetical protein